MLNGIVALIFVIVIVIVFVVIVCGDDNNIAVLNMMDKNARKRRNRN